MKINTSRVSVAFGLLILLTALGKHVLHAHPTSAKPNIVYVMCDDLGYGDIHCLAPETSKIPTPHADQLAREGMVFTDAHSGSSVCSPNWKRTFTAVAAPSAPHPRMMSTALFSGRASRSRVPLDRERTTETG